MTLALAVVLGLATGCQPEPAPSPTTPVFASEDEAFAAAEETYRAYVDALNQVDLSDPETFEAVYEWTTGDANAGERKSLTQMHADGWTVEGATVVTAVNPIQYSADADPSVVLQACTDVSSVEVLDRGGTSVVDPDRPVAQASLVALDRSPTSATGMVISSIDGGDHVC